MTDKESTEGTVRKNQPSPFDVGKKYGGLLLIGLLAITLLVIFSGGSTDTAVEDETVDTSKSGDGFETGTGTNNSEDKTKTAEKDIVIVTMGSKTYRVDVSPATCNSNLETTSIDVEKFDLRSIDSEGVWFIKKPLVEIENADKGVIFATVVIKRKNLEKFFLEFDGVEFQNLHTDDGNNIYADIKTAKNVQVETYTTMEPAIGITHSETKTIPASIDDFLLAENIFGAEKTSGDNWDFVMLRITLSRYTD